MKQYLEKVIAGNDLTQDEMNAAFELIMAGETTPAQMGGFLIGLRMKGETAAEIAGAAASMRRHAVLIDVAGMPVVDTCGTGGDGSNTFNISTAAAFVVAGAGVAVAKHGNKAVSSKCGSADVLTSLGVQVNVAPDVMEESIREAGIGFLFAPALHPAMKHAMPVRKEMGVRTIFNMLGPLTNPAGAKGQILGVFSPELTEPFANVLKELGSNRALIVHGSDGLDEITTTTTTRISELRDGKITTYDFDPADHFEDYAAPSALAGGDPSENAKIVRDILSGTAGPGRDIVSLNAAGALIAGGKADSFKDALPLACASIDSGKALQALEALVNVTNA